MKLQSHIPIVAQRFHQIDYDSRLVSIGSCFSEHIGHKLSYFKFQNTVNPFGILFTPVAIETLVTNAINQEPYDGSQLIYHFERYHCFDAHSSMSGGDEDEVLSGLNMAISSTFDELSSASHIIITLGTAWVYRHIESNKYVANCHKVPQKHFLKELLSIEEVVTSLQSIVELVRSINNKAQFIFTVSPVRHLKDGFIENTRSKAHLISAVHEMVEDYDVCHYFPSYELMMDELRDYRFYKDDLVHPSHMAINYIWEKFENAWISDSEKEMMNTIDTIQKGMDHKPFNESSQAHQEFLERLESLKLKVAERSSHIQF